MGFLQLDQSGSPGHGRRVRRRIHSAVIVGPKSQLRQRVADRLSEALGMPEIVICDLKNTDSAQLEFGAKVPKVGPVDVVVVLANALERGESAWPAAGLVEDIVQAFPMAPDSSVVLVTSALVYGARPTNPVPITEAAPVAPNIELGLAGRLVAIEHRARECFAQSKAEGLNKLAVLRPSIVLGDARRWPDSDLVSGIEDLRGDRDPPIQFVHVDDLATAISLCCEEELVGIYNVASDGWLEGAEVRALAGRPKNPLLPSRYVRFRQRRAALNMGSLSAYAMYPWVVATDRLCALGWKPSYTNEQAYITVHRAPVWSRLSPKRRQEIALVSSSVTLVGLIAGVVVYVKRLWRSWS